jgi:hypothetical protein
VTPRRALPLILFPILFPSFGHALTFSVEMSKKAYLRYELVPLEVRIEDLRGEPLTGLAPDVRVYEGPTLINNGMGRTCLKYDGTTGTYKGTWPLPFAPNLGSYGVEITVPLPDERFVITNSTEIEVLGRMPPPIDTSICAMTMEAQTNLIEHPVSHPITGRWDWRNYTSWAELLCANTILYSVGWTIEGKVTSEDPWVAAGPSTFGRLAEEAHKRGFKFGGWIGSFLVWGPPQLGLGYGYSWEYDEGRLRRNHHVSLDDRKRMQDIVRLAKRIDSDPNVDYVGFDYMRPGPGGLEMVNTFVDSMCIPTPIDWGRLNVHQKMRWLGKILWERSDSIICARWDWWRAHKSASTLAMIIEEAELVKPVWVFMLGWDKGHDHGQDPIMMNDAGASFCAVMLYESTAQVEKAMIGQWSNYLTGGDVNLVVGEAVDWELMGKSKEPEAPQEFTIRLGGGIRGLGRDEPARGLFWHDLTRTHWGSPGPYSRMEWVNAGAAAFTRLRTARGELPFRTRVVPGRSRSVVHVENVSGQALQDVRVTVIETPGIALQDGMSKTIPRVEAGEERSVSFGLRPDSRSMVAFTIECNGKKGVDFEYYPNPYRNRPFRRFESVHAGGDVLVVSSPTEVAFALGRSLRQSSYSCNRISYESLPSDVVKKYRYIVVIDTDVSSDPGLKDEILIYIHSGGTGLFVSCAGIELAPNRAGPAGSQLGPLGQGTFAILDKSHLTSIAQILPHLK